MGFSDSLENDVMNSYFGSGSAPYVMGTHYVGLSTTTPTDAGGNFTEPVGQGYARVSVANNYASWPPPATAGVKKNGAAITFPQCTGVGATWGTITYFGIFGASSGGTPFVTGQLTVSKTVSEGDILSFASASLTITLD